jgi:predicted site-specific integrase-resolvase
MNILLIKEKERYAINGERLLDNQDLCFMLNVGRRTLQRFRASGFLPYKCINQKLYYMESDVLKFIKEHYAIDGERLLDNQDLCFMLNVGRRTLQRFRASGFLPYMRINQKLYYLESDVLKFTKERYKIDGERLLNNQDLCFMLNVNKRTLQRFRASGFLPYKSINQKLYYLESDVLKFIKEHLK